MPTYSPHLNPIETMWAMYKKIFYRKLAKMKALNLPPKVMETVDETDQQITQSVVKRLVKSKLLQPE